MQTQKKTLRFDIRGLTPEQAVLIRTYAYTLKYESDPKHSSAYKLLKDNPTTPLSQLVYRLRKEFGVYKRPAGLKKIAQDCGLPYTE